MFRHRTKPCALQQQVTGMQHSTYGAEFSSSQLLPSAEHQRHGATLKCSGVNDSACLGATPAKRNLLHASLCHLARPPPSLLLSPLPSFAYRVESEFERTFMTKNSDHLDFWEDGLAHHPQKSSSSPDHAAAHRSAQRGGHYGRSRRLKTS